jgi:hypothetical protein
MHARYLRRAAHGRRKCLDVRGREDGEGWTMGGCGNLFVLVPWSRRRSQRRGVPDRERELRPAGGRSRDGLRRMLRPAGRGS